VMKKIFVKNLMVPLEEYATINENASLYDAVIVLEKAQKAHSRSEGKYPHRAVLVYGRNHKIVGKLSQLDILRGLEPKYKRAGVVSGRMMASGFSQEFLKSLVQEFALWDKPLLDICKKATELKVKDCMYVPDAGEFVDADDSLGVAIHQLVLGHHQSLLVTKDKEIAGILRLVDVFKEVCDAIKSCQI